MKKLDLIREEPKIAFAEWRPWRQRETTYDPIHEVPREFDYPGIYLLAHFGNAKLISRLNKALRHLSSKIIYIGSSTKVTNRLEGKRHYTASRKYVEVFNDQNFSKLFFSIAHLEWHIDSFEGEDKVKQAYLLYAERKLIWEYVKKYGRLPILNKQ